MASAKQIAANRANAQRSTGPKTAAGQLKSSRNSCRHGLSLPLSVDLQTRANIETLAQAIAGEHATEDQLQVAELIAEAQLDLKRIRAARFGAAGLTSEWSRRALCSVTSCCRGARLIRER